MIRALLSFLTAPTPHDYVPSLGWVDGLPGSLAPRLRKVDEQKARDQQAKRLRAFPGRRSGHQHNRRDSDA